MEFGPSLSAYAAPSIYLRARKPPKKKEKSPQAPTVSDTPQGEGEGDGGKKGVVAGDSYNEVQGGGDDNDDIRDINNINHNNNNNTTAAAATNYNNEDRDKVADTHIEHLSKNSNNNNSRKGTASNVKAAATAAAGQERKRASSFRAAASSSFGLLKRQSRHNKTNSGSASSGSIRSRLSLEEHPLAFHLSSSSSTSSAVTAPAVSASATGTPPQPPTLRYPTGTGTGTGTDQVEGNNNSRINTHANASAKATHSKSKSTSNVTNPRHDLSSSSTSSSSSSPSPSPWYSRFTRLKLDTSSAGNTGSRAHADRPRSPSLLNPATTSNTSTSTTTTASILRSGSISGSNPGSTLPEEHRLPDLPDLPDLLPELPDLLPGLLPDLSNLPNLIIQEVQGAQEIPELRDSNLPNRIENSTSTNHISRNTAADTSTSSTSSTSNTFNTSSTCSTAITQGPTQGWNPLANPPANPPANSPPVPSSSGGGRVVANSNSNAPTNQICSTSSSTRSSTSGNTSKPPHFAPISEPVSVPVPVAYWPDLSATTTTTTPTAAATAPSTTTNRKTTTTSTSTPTPASTPASTSTTATSTTTIASRNKTSSTEHHRNIIVHDNKFINFDIERPGYNPIITGIPSLSSSSSSPPPSIAATTSTTVIPTASTSAFASAFAAASALDPLSAPPASAVERSTTAPERLPAYASSTVPSRQDQPENPAESVDLDYHDPGNSNHPKKLHKRDPHHRSHQNSPLRSSIVSPARARTRTNHPQSPKSDRSPRSPKSPKSPKSPQRPFTSSTHTFYHVDAPAVPPVPLTSAGSKQEEYEDTVLDTLSTDPSIYMMSRNPSLSAPSGGTSLSSTPNPNHRATRMASHETLPPSSGEGSVGTSAASVTAKPHLANAKPLIVRNNRTYIHDPTLQYPLPVDLTELHRQSLRTLLLFQLFGGPITSPAFANKPPTRVLEVGCGSGFWSMMCHRYFAQHGHCNISFTGLDVVPLAGTGPDPNSKPDKDMRWRFVQHDIRRTPWPLADAEFDLIMVKDMALAGAVGYQGGNMDEFHRLLKPGGVLEVWETDHTIRMLRPHAPKTKTTSNSHATPRLDDNTDSSSDEEEEEDDATRLGAYVMTANTPLSAPLNTFLVEYNGWITKALEARGLSAVPCTLIGPWLLQEAEDLMDVRSKRLAVPLSEIRWEREGVGGVVTKDGKSYIDSMKGKARSVDAGASAPSPSSTTGPSVAAALRDLKDGEAGTSGSGSGMTFGKTLTSAQSALRRTALETVVGLIHSFEPIIREISGKSQDEWDGWAGKMMNDLLREGGTSWGECLEVGAWSARKRKK